MTQSVNEENVRRIVEEVVSRVVGSMSAGSAGAAGASAAGPGLFGNADDAVAAADRAQKALVASTLEARKRIIEAIRQVTRDHAEELSRLTLEETGMGRFEDKIQKHLLAADLTPGVEDLAPTSWTGDHGLTVEEMAPYGVIAAITPSTHPVPTLVNNAISMIAAGNAVVVNPHPGAKRVSAYAARLVNEAVIKAGGPPNLVAMIQDPTIESAGELFTHRGVRLILVTGGAAVARAAMAAPKKAIVAGPGNPPVVVDETANLEKAARDIIQGASFDNNIICVSEKQVFVVESVADELKSRMLRHAAFELTTTQIEQLAQMAFKPGDGGHVQLNRDLVGRNASVLAQHIGLHVDDGVRLLIGETEASSLFVTQEQMMPFLPIVRVSNIDQAIQAAIESEHGLLHSAMIHSRNIENMHNMACLMDTTIFVKNGPSLASVGAGGEGSSTFSIAGPTGEGITTARTFTRRRRCTLVDYFRII